MPKTPKQYVTARTLSSETGRDSRTLAKLLLAQVEPEAVITTPAKPEGVPIFDCRRNCCLVRRFFHFRSATEANPHA